MEQIKKKSLKQKRQEQNIVPNMEQNITELELRNIEKDLTITDLELAVLELHAKGE